jgi:mannose-6-phosphate isomerase-like protein (cupin superfamily)
VIEQSGLFQPPSSTAIYTEERCYITEILNSQRDPEVSVARCQVEPGVTTQLHSLATAERYIIESGTGSMELACESWFPVTPGDCVLIPPDCAQRIKNTGATPLVFLCICSPRFQADHYINLETAASGDAD